MKNKLLKLKAISLLTLLFSFNAQADVDYGYLYPTMLPNEKTMNDLPYAIPLHVRIVVARFNRWRA